MMNKALLKTLLAACASVLALCAFAADTAKQDKKPEIDYYAMAMKVSNTSYAKLSAKIDWNKTCGKIKPLHGVNNSPIRHNADYPEFREAGFPFMRTHDTSGRFGGNVYIDVPNIFRNFDADPEDPASYDFAFTDAYLKGLEKTNTKIFYRLGVTIENNHHIKAYRIFPPKDYLKWAKICEGIIKHYTQGWANGVKYDIQYWEIWNEPENKMMWKGTRQEFLDFYKTAAKYLKGKFPHLKIGGFGHCGFFSLTRKPQDDPSRGLGVLEWFDDLIKIASDKNDPAPLDFFSWHLYSDQPLEIGVHSEYVRNKLDAAGLTKTESIFDEWNYSLDTRKPELRNNVGASMCAAAFCVMQRGRVDKAMYYDATPTRAYCGLFEFPALTYTRTFFAFKAFNHLYQLGDCVQTPNLQKHSLFICAATDADKRNKAILISNYTSGGRNIKLDFEGNPESVIVIDRDYIFTEINTKLTADKVLHMAPFSTYLIKIK